MYYCFSCVCRCLQLVLVPLVVFTGVTVVTLTWAIRLRLEGLSVRDPRPHKFEPMLIAGSALIAGIRASPQHLYAPSYCVRQRVSGVLAV
jgi:hypothetical protein